MSVFVDSTPYKERYPVGSMVQVRSVVVLEEFSKSWHLHHPLQPEQLQYADAILEITGVSYYHGGAVLYELDGVAALWHECCVKAVSLIDPGHNGGV